MKKIFFVFAFILCCFSLFAQELPDWVLDIAVEGNLKAAVKRLNINTEEYFVFPLENKITSNESFDLRKYSIIIAFREIVEPTLEQNIGLRFNEDGEVINRTRKSNLGFTTYTYTEGGILKYSEFFEDKERGLIFPLMDADEEGKRVVHGDCLNDILFCLKNNPMLKKMKIEAEYYVYTEIPEQKTNWLIGKNEKLNKNSEKNNLNKKQNKNLNKNMNRNLNKKMTEVPVIVDKGTEFSIDKQYTECTGYYIFTLPKSIFSQKERDVLEPVLIK